MLSTTWDVLAIFILALFMVLMDVAILLLLVIFELLFYVVKGIAVRCLDMTLTGGGINPRDDGSTPG